MTMNKSNVGEISTVYFMYSGEAGMGLGKLLKVFSDLYSATRASRGTGWFGGDALIIERKAILADNGSHYAIAGDAIDIDGLAEASDKQIREEAMAMLTPEQKRVLGLK